KAMIDDGVLKGPNVDVALGLHVMSSMPVGKVAYRTGPMMAASDRFDVLVKGRGGHGAHPEQTIDAVMIAAHIVVALQTIVARNLNPEEIGVVTVGAIHAGEASNVIAETAQLRGTIRSFTPETRELLHRRVKEICMGVAATFGAEAEVTSVYGVDATVNAEAPSGVVYQAAAALVGEENIDTNYRTTGGEDFSAVLAAVPGNFFMLGVRNDERGLNFPHHNPRFDIDESSLPTGVAILCDAAVRCLNGEHEGS
ncbi:MAG TPA: amidohydrolase, partial [Roseiflexaceae bacterium]|nr:amidohydrolase [Roseiflexaceae bacterium]